MYLENCSTRVKAGIMMTITLLNMHAISNVIIMITISVQGTPLLYSLLKSKTWVGNYILWYYVINSSMCHVV